MLTHKQIFIDVDKKTLGLSPSSLKAFIDENCELRNDGFLNIHADFTVHPYNKNLKLKVKSLIFFFKKKKTKYVPHLWEELK